MTKIIMSAMVETVIGGVIGVILLILFMAWICGAFDDIRWL